MSEGQITYLALGDSYTIGTGASHESRNFPSLLAHKIEEQISRSVRVVNPAVNGFTTIDLLAKEIGFIDRLEPDLVSVLIGVNDLVGGRTVEQYRESLVEIYEPIAALGLAPGHVIAISIPDWSIVPAARDYGNPEEIRSLTDAFNAAAGVEASKRAFTWVDISEVSRSGLESSGWISADNLHPGDVQYAAWADAIWIQAGESWSRARGRSESLRP
jgi:lysophospholipase L1-like esterase